MVIWGVVDNMGVKVNLNKLRGLRAELGLTQEEIADKIGISKHSYNRKERGVRKFTLVEAKKLADLFGLSIEEIFFTKGLTGTERNKD